MAKKYFVQRNGSWHTWKFLQLRQNDPQWREAYLAAKKQRRKDAVSGTIISLLVLFLATVGVYFVVEIYGNNHPTVESPVLTDSSSVVTEESSTLDSSTITASSEVPPLTLSSAEEQVTQLFQERAQNDPDWAFLNNAPYGPLAYQAEDGKIAVEVRQASEDVSHDSWIANFKENENGQLIETSNILGENIE